MASGTASAGRSRPEIGPDPAPAGGDARDPGRCGAGGLTLRPGLRFVATDEDGGIHGVSGVGAEGRIDFGLDYRLDGNVALEFEGSIRGSAGGIARATARASA